MSRLLLGTVPTRHFPWRRALQICIFALLVGVLALRLFVFQLAFVHGVMMAPALLEGDIVSVLKRGQPKLGDVVVVDNGQRAVWRRVLGGPGDEIGTEDGVLTRNGVPLDTQMAGFFGYYEGEERVERRQQRLIETLEDGRSHVVLGDHQGALRPWRLNFEPVEVPPEHFFVFCDNRAACPLDELSGVVHQDAIDGIASRLLWYGDNRMESLNYGQSFMPLQSVSMDTFGE